jgi:cytochrome c556
MSYWALGSVGMLVGRQGSSLDSAESVVTDTIAARKRARRQGSLLHQVSQLRCLLAKRQVRRYIALGGRFVVVTTLVMAMLASTLARADDDDAIEYRQAIMKTMGEQSAAISLILEKKAPPENLAVHARILAVAASTALKAFEPRVIGGHATAEVWSKWPDFSRRMNELTSVLEAFSRTVERGGLSAAAPKVSAVLTCKGCHDLYRSPSEEASPKLADVAGKNAIEYRERIMRSLNDQAEALGLIVSTSIPDENTTAHLDILALVASTALRAFEQRVPGGEAKPEVWSDWADFSRRMNEFADRTAGAARLAKEKGAKAGLSDIDGTLTCKRCHDVYRAEEKR